MPDRMAAGPSSVPSARGLRRVRCWGGAFLVAALVAGSGCRPALHLVRTALHDRDTQAATPAGFADDESRMNRTAVAETWHVPPAAAEAERRLASAVTPEYVTRNVLLSGDTRLYTNRDGARTDILHEYFLPPARLAAWLGRVRPILLTSGTDLLNATIRDVRADHETVLRYAPTDRLGVVMFYSQARTPPAEAQMATLTRALVDAALDEGGTYYLPYRAHATRAQVARAYPMAPAFFAAKARVDPDTLFRNGFYEAYGPPSPCASC